MGIGVSLILIAAGAILAFAVHVTGHGFNVHRLDPPSSPETLLPSTALLQLLVRCFIAKEQAFKTFRRV